MIQGSKTIGRLLNQRVQRTPENKAIGWIENQEVKSLTFTEYKNTIAQLAGGLLKIGMQPLEKVALFAHTCKEWHLLDMAVINSRAILVPIYPSYLAHEVDFIFTHSDSTIMIVEDDKQLERVLPNLEKWKNLKLIISIKDLDPELVKKFRNSVKYYTYKEILNIGIEEVRNNPELFETLISQQKPEDVASIIYTSGTTGEPKGAVITHNGFITMLMNVIASTNGAFTENDVSLTFLPLSHVLGRCDSLLPLPFGIQSVYAESLEKMVDNISVVKPTVMLAVPRIFEKIYAKVMEQINEGSFVKKQAFKWAVNAAQKYFEKLDQDLSPTTREILEYKAAYAAVFSKIYNRFGGRVRYFVSGGAPLSPEIIKFLRYANLTILEGYGLTETIAPCVLNPLSKQIPGTVGRPMGEVEIKFAEDGEILIKSEALFTEYYKNPQATQDAFEDGWFKTGDVGEFNSKGYLRITDRKKDIIITSGGKNVAPQKIENLAKTKPHISQMVVIGEKRNYLTALIGIEKESFLGDLESLGLGPEVTVEELARHMGVREIIQNEINEVNRDLARFETIKSFCIITQEFTTDNFLTPSLKVKRKAVTEHYKAEIEAMYQ